MSPQITPSRARTRQRRKQGHYSASVDRTLALMQARTETARSAGAVARPEEAAAVSLDSAHPANCRIGWSQVRQNARNELQALHLMRPPPGPSHLLTHAYLVCGVCGV